jgi:hypothetical protein
MKGDVVNFEIGTGIYNVVFEDGDLDEFTEKELDEIVSFAITSPAWKPPSNSPRKSTRALTTSIEASQPTKPAKASPPKKNVKLSPKKEVTKEPILTGVIKAHKYAIGTLVEKVIFKK